MLQINMPLATNAPTLPSELRPRAGVCMEVKGAERRVNITLQGVICGSSAESLLEFLHGASTLVGNKWSLQMSELLVLSSSGLRGLARFAKHLRRRGYEVEVLGVSRPVYASLQDLELANAFAWAN
jgi:anti-anti-sigma regulatory factor